MPLPPWLPVQPCKGIPLCNRTTSSSSTRKRTVVTKCTARPLLPLLLTRLLLIRLRQTMIRRPCLHLLLESPPPCPHCSHSRIPQMLTRKDSHPSLPFTMKPAPFSRLLHTIKIDEWAVAYAPHPTPKEWKNGIHTHVEMIGCTLYYPQRYSRRNWHPQSEFWRRRRWKRTMSRDI